MCNSAHASAILSNISKDDAARVVELLSQLGGELCRITGVGLNIRLIGESLPATPLDQEQVCPELIFPMLGQGVLDAASTCLSLMADLEWLLRNHAAVASDKERGRSQ